MASSSGTLFHTSGRAILLQPQHALLPADTTPVSPDYVFRAGDVEVRLYAYGGQDWVWWSHPLLGQVEAPVAHVPLDASDGDVPPWHSRWNEAESWPKSPMISRTI
ncbi:MAG: hypothetical protein AAGA56_07520 [Myxococcota bacterium]